MPTKIFTTARFVLPRRSPENYCRSASLVPTTHPGTVGCFELLADDARHFPQISSFRVSMGELLPKASVSLPKVKPSHRSNPNVVARKNSLLMLLQQYMQARLPQPCRAHAQIEPVNHIRSLINTERGIISAFPIIESNIENADSPSMLLGLR